MNKLRLTGSLLTRLLGLLLVYVSCVQVGYAQQSGGGNYPTGNGVRVREVDGSPNVPGTQTLVFPNGSLTRAGQTVTVTIAGGAALTATQIGFGSGANTLTGSSAFTYTDSTGVVDLTKTLNSSVRFTVGNGSNGTSAQARFGASADVSGAALVAYSSGFTTSGLRTANSAVLDLDGNTSVFLGQSTGQFRWGLGTTEYARLTSTVFSLFALSGTNTGLTVTSAASGAGVTLAVAGGGTNENRIDKAKGTGIIRVVPDTAGAGTVVIGNSTDTADAQLSVYSQSTTRPALKLNMPSGAASTQEAFGNYNNGTRNLYITADGSLLYNTDNTVDIGAFGANRPRRIFTAGYIFSGSGLYFAGRGWIGDGGADGVLLIQNNAQNDFSRLQFGGTTSSFPALKRSSAELQVRLADDSAYAALTASITNLDKTITAGGTTGDQTINKSSFTVNFAAAATAITVTNSFVTANSNIICTAQTNDMTLKSVAAAPGSGSVVLTANAAATAETRVGCVIHN